MGGYLTTLRHIDFCHRSASAMTTPSGLALVSHHFTFSILQTFNILHHLIDSFDPFDSLIFLIVTTMPPKNSGFEWGIYRGEIESLRARGTSTKDIHQCLFDRYNDIPSSHRTLERQVKTWEEEDSSFTRRYSIYEDLRLIEFCNNEWLYNANHEEMLEAI